MNELKPHSTESDLEDRMIEKDFKRIEFTTYTNKIHFLSRLNIFCLE